MYDLPKKTLYTYLNNPLLDKFSFAHVSTKDLAAEIDKYKAKTKTMPKPEEQALLFYMSNHGFHLIKAKYSEFEVLPDDVAKLVEDHMKITNDIAKRLFCYIVLISVEEAHFLPSQAEHFHDYMSSTYGSEFGDYVKGNCKGELTSFKSLPMTTGTYLRGMRSVFDFGKWQGGFGGKPWGNIVGLTASVAFGRESFEMMADYAFSLCHNNGSMFNKGKLYGMYSSFIYDILDIQASGQIPNWINENKSSTFVTPQIKDMHERLAKIFPEEFKKPLDKSRVQSSGKVRKENEKKKMAAWGVNNYAPAAVPEQPKAPPLSAMDKMLIGDFKKQKLI